MNIDYLTGKLKEWSLILYGTSESPYSNVSSHNSRPRTEEMPSSDMEPSKTAFFQTHMETMEEEEDYTGDLPNVSFSLFFFPQSHHLVQAIIVVLVFLTRFPHHHHFGKN